MVKEITNGQPVTDAVELDDVTEAFIREVRAESEKRQREAMQEAALPFINQEQAALMLFIRRSHLEGSWRLQSDGKTLRKEG
jgi:hypothetical protein